MMDVFMNKSYRDQYKAGKLQYPGSIMIPENLQAHCLQMAKYIYGCYCNNDTSIFCGGVNMRNRPYSVLRAYARGVQDPTKYDKWMEDEEDVNGEHFMNISRDIVQILPKFRDFIKGKFEEVEFDFNVTAVDPLARKEREINKAKRKLALRPQMKALFDATGMPSTARDQDVGIESDRDVDLLYALGGDRLFYEVLMRAGIMSVEYESEWKDELKDRIIDDLIDLNNFAIWTYVDRSGKIKAKYVDPERLVIQKTSHNNHMGAQYGGYIENYSIGQLRMESELTERELVEIARRYSSFPANKGINNNFNTIGYDSFREMYYKQSQHQPYDQVTVQVMPICFIAAEAEKYVYGYHQRSGSMIFDPVARDAQLSRRDESRGKTFMENAIQYVYTAKWVVGTDYIFDCQKEYGTVRAGKPGFKTAQLPLHVYCGDTPSLVERCIGFVDDLQLATLKRRNTIARIPPGPRMVIDASKLNDSVTIGDQSYSMLEMTKMFPKTGYMIIQSKGEFDYLGQGAANGKPFEFLPLGIAEDLTVYSNEFHGAVASIKMVLGIEDINLSQQPDLLVGVMKGVEAQTNTSLRTTFKAYKLMNLMARKYWMIKWQCLLTEGDIQITYLPIGANTVESVTMLKELTSYEFGLMAEVLPSNEERTLLMQFLYSKRDTGQIDVHHVFAIEQQIRAGQIKLAQLYIAKAIREKQIMMQQQELEKIRANGEANSQPVIAEMRAKMELNQQEHALAMQLEQTKAQWEDWKDKQKFGREQYGKGVEKGMEMAQSEMTQTV